MSLVGCAVVATPVATPHATLLEQYASAPRISGPGGFRQGFVQATVVVVEDDSVTATLASDKLPSQYAHPIIRSRAAKRAACPAVVFRLSNLGTAPEQLVLPVRYVNGVSYAGFSGADGFLTGTVTLRGGQAGLALPLGMVHTARNRDLVASIRVINQRGEVVPLRYLPEGNNTGAVISTPRNRALGRENDFVAHERIGGVDFVAVVPRGACG